MVTPFLLQARAARPGGGGPARRCLTTGYTRQSPGRPFCRPTLRPTPSEYTEWQRWPGRASHLYDSVRAGCHLSRATVLALRAVTSPWPPISTLLRINEYSSMQWADTRQSTLTAYTDGNIEHTYVVVTLNIGHINIKINLEKNMMQAFGT